MYKIVYTEYKRNKHLEYNTTSYTILWQRDKHFYVQVEKIPFAVTTVWSCYHKLFRKSSLLGQVLIVIRINFYSQFLFVG